MGKRYNWFCTIVAGFGSMLYGIDNVVIAGTFAQPGFLHKFHPSATLLGAIATSFYGGTLLGIIGVFALADRFSRKRTLQFGAALGLIGALLQSVAQQIALFTAARVLTGVASGVMLTTVQIYQSEISPPNLRGRMITLQICTINVAGLAIAFTGYGTYHSDNPNLQRLPIALQCVPALALFIGCFFIPFTPRWLVMHGRYEEAKSVLRRLHDDNEDHSFWEKEYTVLVAQLDFEKEETAGVTFWHMFTNKKELKRAGLAVAALTSCQTTGAQTIQVFQSVIYSHLGFDTAKVLLYACIFQILLNLGGAVNLIAIDWLGRRVLFISGLVMLSIILALFTACQAQFERTAETAWGKAGIAMVMILIFFYACTYVSTGYAYAAEILPTKIRAQGMALGMFSAYSMIITFGQVTPIALDKVGYKYLPLFIGFNLLFLPIIAIWCKETKGLSLEEINVVFGETVVARMSELSEDAAHQKTEIRVEQKEYYYGSPGSAKNRCPEKNVRIATVRRYEDEIEDFRCKSKVRMCV
ncbi:uncharacterized protein Z520_01997 [Fonsecaea multimorphosa CBS 102226]|uniref:Major facilitator superfamily (MFS) profile domain-containing protein n=1 Tax=Fonsecaea multimorphosa CBS 102226 TaxID=1442371 RepID=A0A0D2KYF4_9EURO|nr:uncharacterized protein Z520_01997 [Fonsecaea multimorphosa CBS 102226]KIY01859.1 hypothetical protein Z520_01997 [Fonsecaea multimorphosa CBS 102226]